MHWQNLSNYYAKKDTKNFINTIDKALLYAILLGLPACAGLVLLAEELIITLFQYDAFDALSAKKTSLSLTSLWLWLNGVHCNKNLCANFSIKRRH